MRALLVLEDETLFEGRSFTGPGEVLGEVVFNTSMTGYQEILTDPSYRGQIVTMTYPLIGNYGANDEDIESSRIQVEGFVIREYCPFPSNWRAKFTLADYLKKANAIGIEGIDTRALTRHIRLQGAMKGIISTEDLNPKSLLEKVKAFPGLVGRDIATPISCKMPYLWKSGKGYFLRDINNPWQEKGLRVVAIDCGIKFNILRELESRGCEILVVPARVRAEDILSAHPHGLFLSNGPGDPAPISHVIRQVRRLLKRLPIFGICLGHQILALALGGTTFKLRFGHRGANHPVKNLSTGKIEITTQNHGFCVDIDSLAGKGIEITHLNLNDNTLEGMRHKTLPIFSVQYHPEASPGPHDSRYLFDEFINMIE